MADLGTTFTTANSDPSVGGTPRSTNLGDSWTLGRINWSSFNGTGDTVTPVAPFNTGPSAVESVVGYAS